MATADVVDGLGSEREERGVGPAEFVRRLLRERRRARVALPLLRVPAAPDLAERRMTWAAELLKRESVGFLVRAGGWRRRQVVVGERRREGRVWEAGIWERLQVRFGPAPLLLLEAAMRTQGLPSLPPGLEETWAEPVRSGTGDLLALHLVVDPLLASATGPRARERSRVEVDQRELQGAVSGVLVAVGGPGRHVVLARDDGTVLAAAGDPQQGVSDQAAEFLSRAATGQPHTWIDLGPLPRHGRLTARRWPALGLGLLLASGGTRRALDLDSGAMRGALDTLERLMPALDGEGVVGPGPRQALLRLSPLTLLLRPEELGALGPGPARDALAPLLVGDRPALLTWLDEHVARSWLREEAARQALTPARVGAAWSSAGAGLDAFVSATALVERPDALRPLVRFYARFLAHHGTRVPVVQAVQARAEALDRASEREALRQAAASLFAPGRRITAAGERALGRAFVDRSEPERSFLTDYHEVWRPIAPEIEAIRRELAGEIG